MSVTGSIPVQTLVLLKILLVSGLGVVYMASAKNFSASVGRLY